MNNRNPSPFIWVHISHPFKIFCSLDIKIKISRHLVYEFDPCVDSQPMCTVIWIWKAPSLKTKNTRCSCLRKRCSSCDSVAQIIHILINISEICTKLWNPWVSQTTSDSLAIYSSGHRAVTASVAISVSNLAFRAPTTAAIRQKVLISSTPGVSFHYFNWIQYSHTALYFKAQISDHII